MASDIPSTLVPSFTIACKFCLLDVQDKVYLSRAQNVKIIKQNEQYTIESTGSPHFTRYVVDTHFFADKLGLLSPLRPDINVTCSPQCFRRYVEVFTQMLENGELQTRLNDIQRANTPECVVSVDDVPPTAASAVDIDVDAILADMAAICDHLPTTTIPISPATQTAPGGLLMPVDVCASGAWSAFSVEAEGAWGTTWGDDIDDGMGLETDTYGWET